CQASRHPFHADCSRRKAALRKGTTTISRSRWRAREAASLRRLLKLDQRPGKILRAEEDHCPTVGAGFRLAVSENARAGLSQAIAGGQDIIHLVTEMMHAAG